MPDQQNSPRQRPPRPGERPLKPFPYWWLFLALLLLWTVLSWWPQPHPRANIPYSTFVAQVRANNISSVHVTGSTITGTFVKPLLWPQPKTEAKTEGKTEGKATGKSSSATKSESGTSSAKSKPGLSQTEQHPPTHYGEFQTIFPASIGDPTLMPLLKSHNVIVKVSAPSTNWLLTMLIEWLPLLLLFGIFWWMLMRAGRQQSGLFGKLGQMKARRYSNEQPRITFNDVAGADEAKAELQEEVDFLRNPGKYHEVGARIPRGVLLVGAPGTGKTLMARAVAGEAGVPFFSINASEFVEMFVGVGASRVRDLFRQAKEAAPAIVFVDELDAVGRRRGAGLGAVNDEREQTLNQLLGELDGFDERTEVIILAATNRPDVLDPALLRPGRFDRQVVVALPDRKGREGILRIHTRRLRLNPDVDLGVLAGSTIGMSGADLANLSNEAALCAARNNRGEVTMRDFEEAQEKVRLGAARPQLANPEERRVIAYHEGGHAMVAWLTPAADPVYKVTIVPHGQALGLTEQLPGEERHNYTRAYLKARLAVMLGGRTAEEIVFGDVTTGAENDLVEATRLARRMVTRWGMGKLGLVAFKADEEQPFLGYEISQGREYSEATAARIDQEVQSLIEETHQDVKRLLSRAREPLDKLVQVLLAEEMVAGEQLGGILGPRPEPGTDHGGELASLNK